LKKVKIQVILCILVLILTSTLTNYVSAQDTETPPRIYYGGAETNDAESYTLIYHVISGTPNITKWQLYSSFFEKTDLHIQVIAQDEVEDSQTFIPLYIHNPSLGYIEFNHESDHKFSDELIRTYNITINTITYSGIIIDDIEYKILWPPGTQFTGTIQGPVEPVQLDPQPWYSSIPPITIPIGLIVLVIIAWRLKWISI